jgi:hypothetical protein
MTIAFWDVFPILAQAIPAFPATEDDLEDPLPYMFINDMVRFVCLRESESEMDQLAELLEKLLAEGDDETRYLAMDAIETLGEKPEGPMVAKRFSPKSREIWATVYKLGLA